MHEWLTHANVHEVNAFARKYGPISYSQNKLQLSKVRVDAEEHKYIHSARDQYTLHQRMIEIEQEIQTGSLRDKRHHDHWRIPYAFLLAYRDSVSYNRKIQYETLKKHIDVLDKIKEGAESSLTIEEWQEQACRILYYGENNDVASIEQKGIDALKSILKLARISEQCMNLVRLLEVIVECNIGNPKILELMEHQVLFGSVIKFMTDVVRFVDVAQKSEFFSDRFYDTLFFNSLKLMPTSSTAETVSMIKSFENKRAFLEELTENSSQIKVHIAQDMYSIQIEDLVELIKLFKNDEKFSKYLLINLLEKMKAGKKLHFEQLQ